MELALDMSTQKLQLVKKSDQELLLDEVWRKGLQFQILNSGKSKVQLPVRLVRECVQCYFRKLYTRGGNTRH